MNKSRQIGAFMAASAAAMGMATVGLASPAAAAGQGPRPVSNWLNPVQANRSTWLNIAWRTDQRICDVRVRVDGGRRVDVDYPSRHRYTSFSRGDSLRAYRIDYTAVRVTPDFNRNGVAVLRTTIAYDNCGWHARTQYRSSYLSLPVVSYRPPMHGPGFPGGPGWPGGQGWPGGSNTPRPPMGGGFPGGGLPGNGGPGTNNPRPPMGGQPGNNTPRPPMGGQPGNNTPRPPLGGGQNPAQPTPTQTTPAPVQTTTSAPAPTRPTLGPPPGGQPTFGGGNPTRGATVGATVGANGAAVHVDRGADNGPGSN
jgi:hypothetical protein